MKTTNIQPIWSNPWMLSWQRWFGCTKGLGISEALSNFSVDKIKARFLACSSRGWSKTQVVKGVERVDQKNCSLVALVQYPLYTSYCQKHASQKFWNFFMEFRWIARYLRSLHSDRCDFSAVSQCASLTPVAELMQAPCSFRWGYLRNHF